VGLHSYIQGIIVTHHVLSASLLLSSMVSHQQKHDNGDEEGGIEKFYLPEKTVKSLVQSVVSLTMLFG